MRILGIDPGYATVGFGIVDYQGMDFRTVEFGAILTPAHTDFNGRLLQIYDDMDFLLSRYRPQVMRSKSSISIPIKRPASWLLRHAA